MVKLVRMVKLVKMVKVVKLVKMARLVKRMAAVSECGYEQDGHLVVMIVHKDNRVHAVNHSPSLGTEIINTNRLNNQHSWYSNAGCHNSCIFHQ